MTKGVRVLLVEDDFYARNMVEMLLRRDWRTEVSRAVANSSELSHALKDINEHHELIDLFLIDTEIPHDNQWLTDVLRSLANHSFKTTILFMGTAPDLQIAKMLAQSNISGYILKDEIRFSLAWAVSLAAQRHTVVTPSVCHLFDQTTPLPKGTMILDGRNLIAAFSKRDSERACMAFIFSMERHELAHELGISEDYTYGMVSELFEELGLNEVLRGEVNPEQYFGKDPAVLLHVEQAIETIQKSKTAQGQERTMKEKLAKVKEKESLAFHLLTMPEISTIM